MQSKKGKMSGNWVRKGKINETIVVIIPFRSNVYSNPVIISKLCRIIHFFLRNGEFKNLLKTLGDTFCALLILLP